MCTLARVPFTYTTIYTPPQMKFLATPLLYTSFTLLYFSQIDASYFVRITVTLVVFLNTTYNNFTAESDDRKVLKIGQHLAKLMAKVTLIGLFFCTIH